MRYSCLCTLAPVLLASLIGGRCWAVVSSGTSTLDFEDIFGPVDVGQQINGPGSPTIAGVTFASPDPLTFSYGKDPGGPAQVRSPFQSDWFGFFCFGNGTTISFPAPIYSLSFDTGTRDIWVSDSFVLSATGVAPLNFTTVWQELRNIAVTFPTPVTSVNIKWTAGVGSVLGIDSMTYSTVPEPSLTLISMLLTLAAVRRRHNR